MIKFSILIFLIFSANICFAHGVYYQQLEGGIGIAAKYDNGTPISFSAVKVLSTDNSEFQLGSTDKYGHFFFLPDEKGEWTIFVNDGMGHGIEAKIIVNESLEMEEQSHHLPVWYKILFGISIIFGFTGIMFYFSATKKG